MNDIDLIVKLIEDNIGDNNEVHISYELYNLIKEKILLYKGKQNIIGDTYVGNILLNNKTIKIYYNILYEFDEIEFKK